MIVRLELHDPSNSQILQRRKIRMQWRSPSGGSIGPPSPDESSNNEDYEDQERNRKERQNRAFLGTRRTPHLLFTRFLID
jgi:hypothetical protein